jgi:uncharacterized protein
MENRPPTPPYSPTPAPLNDSESRTWAMVAHLSSLSALVTGIGFILGPLIVWQIQKERSAFVDFHGKEAVNFNITILIAVAVCYFLFLVLIGFFLLWIVGAVWLVFTVVAGIKANNGEYYRYPLSIRFIK